MFDKWLGLTLYGCDTTIEWIFHALCHHRFAVGLPEWRVLIGVECDSQCGCVHDDGRCSCPSSEGFAVADATDYTVGHLTSTHR